jgi:spore coat protein U-like protein
MTLSRQRLARSARSIAIVGLVLAPASAQAAVDCTVEATPLSFGAFSPLDGDAHDSDAWITVACYSDTGSESTSYEIALDAGSAGSFASRAMNSGGNALAYNLYRDAGRTMVWGSGSSAQSVTDNLALDSANVTYSKDYPVYGRVLAGQSQAHIGTYTDNVTITISY